MKNLVFNLRTAKAQAEGCATVTKSRRMAKILTTLTLLLTLCVGQMWAGAGFYEVYFTYSYNGTTSNATYTNSTSTTQTIDLGTLTADFKITSIYLKYWKDGSGNMCGGLVDYYISSDQEYQPSWTWTSKGGNNHELSSTANWTIAQYNTGASGSYTFWYRFKTWGSSSSSSGCSDNYYIPTNSNNKNKFTYNIAPPAVSGFGVSTSGFLAGSGTSSDPYLVKSGNSLTFTVSGSKARTDANSTFNYWLNSGTKKTSGTLSTGSITSTSLQSATIHGQCINNSSSSLVGTESTSTIYYKAVSVKDISVYIYVGGRTSAEINSVEMNGCTPYVGTKALSSVKINNQSAGAPKFTLSGNWLYYTFTNVTKVSNITCARDGGNIFTGEITDNVYYMYDGTELDSQCVPRANPTWGTAPTNGAIGGSMTASVSGAPAGATITWSSTNPSAATVNSSGVISYVAAGNTTITARVTWSATGDYCAGSYDLTKEISCTSGATVSVERTCAAYVAAGVAEQVSAHITFTGTSSGWKYRIKQGWSTGYETGWLDASGTSADWTMTGGMDAGERTYTVELYTTEGAATPVSAANFSVTGETAYNTTIAAGANGSVSPSGTVYANNNHVHPTITATPNEHYHFVNWTSNNAAASVADDNSATTTVTATASGYTITANFAGDKYTITYKDQGGVDYSGNNEGALPATHTYGTATDLVNGTKEGFTFGGWYTNSECTVSAGSSIGATAKTSNFTLYAKWTEKMSTLSTSNSYSVGDPSFADPTKSVSSIGISTTATVTAHANELGYTLTGWTITGGTRTDGGAENANPITVRSNGDGAAVSVTANYVGSNTPVNIFLPNTGNSWSTSDENWKFYKLPGEVENTVTLAVDINKSDYASSNYQLGFNIYHADWGDKWWHNKGNDDSYMDAHNCTDWGFNTKDGIYKTNLDLNVSGRYTFTLKNSNSSGSQKLSVTYPDKSFIEGDFPTAWSEDAYTLTENGDIQSVRINITTKGDKQFRLVSHGKLFGTSTKITASANSQTLSAKNMADGGAVMTLDAYVTGAYTFTYNKSSQNLTVTFPAAYRVTYSVGTGYTSMGRVSTEPSISSGDYVIAGTNITFTATPNLGYKFVGWYSNDACTGDAISTNATYNIASLSANTTLYAKWTPNQYTVTLDKQTSAEGYGGNAGSVTDQTVTFDATPATVSGTMPTAAQGYGFMGFYTATGGGGSKIINADGTWNNVSGYISGGKWIRDGGATLYAYYKKAEITAITLNSSILDPVDAGEGWVIANPTIAPTPAGTTKICWELLYDNGNSVPAGHEAQAYTEGDTKPNQVRFSITGLAAGEYKIKATLRTGDDCSGGTLLSEREVSFTIASGYTVTIQYKDTEGNTIAPSTTSPGKATDWTSISAPTIVGYNFSTWVPGDGITLESSATTNSNRFKATFNGTLTARYTKKRVIYFNNTLGWSNVYVYFYSGEYWDGNKGTGSQTGGTYTGKHGRMQPVSEGSKIYYFDAEGASVNASYTYVAFTELEQTDYQYFAETTSVKNKVAYRGDYNSTKLPMFVPLADQTPVSKNSNLANYYNEGYWMNYPENTGYTLRIYSSSGASEPTRTIRFPFSNDKKMPLKLDVEFNEAATNYYFNIYREDGTVLSAEYGMNTNWHSDVRLNNPSTKISIKTTAPGIYTFTLVYKNTPNLDYYISVDYPILENDYRISYSDNATWSQGSAHTSGWYHPSDVIRKNTDAEVTQYDTVSFYIAKGDGITASMKFQYASEIVEAGAVTWTDVAGGGITLSDFSEVITKAGVYNFIIKQEGTADPVVEKVEPYTGKFYIRTDCAGSTKWDYYRASDHEMPYTEFSMSDANSFGEKYSHYYTHWCPGGTNIKFVVANEYSSCISDTLESDLHNWGNLNDGGWLKHQDGKSETEDIYSANVRFMYNQETNKISRAYVASSTNPARKFLVLRGNQVIKGEDGSTAINDQSVTNGAILSDKENWIYERILYINPGTRFKLFACYAEADPTQSGAQYFRGAYDSDNFTTNANSVILISGTTDSYQKARVLYDFKTNRLVCAWLPSDEPIDETLNIDADVMVIRDHQEAAECITFSGDGELKKVKTVYGAMKFNRWTLNNRYRGKGGVEDNNKDHCDSPEDIAEYHGILPAGEQKSVYERSLYFISFPFDVKVSEIFGFGTYGKHWILEYYDGLNRAKNGYWIDSPANWKYVTPSMAKTYELKAYEGYILCLSLGRMAYDNTEFWANNISNVELYFPSKTPMTNIQTTDVTIPGLSDEYRCTINRGDGTEGDRRVKDSYWRCLGVPSYDIYAGQLKAGEGGSVINWQTDYSTFPFLYAWNMNDNTLTPQSTDHFTFKPMHAYLTQIGTAIYWKNVSATPAVMARQTEEPTEYNWCLTLNAGEQMIDQTYVRMSTDEVITNEFDFGQDLSKELNTGRSDIYSFIGNERAAANSMQMNTETTTIVPLGLNIEATGEYTFSIPDGTNGIGITLIDEETGIRTSLSALDYTVELAAGDYTERFWLEISPIQNTPTGIEEPTSDSSLKGRAQKRIIDGVLYIVKDGKIFDARGTRVE